MKQVMSSNKLLHFKYFFYIINNVKLNKYFIKSIWKNYF